MQCYASPCNPADVLTLAEVLRLDDVRELRPIARAHRPESAVWGGNTHSIECVRNVLALAIWSVSETFGHSMNCEIYFSKRIYSFCRSSAVKGIFKTLNFFDKKLRISLRTITRRYDVD